MICVFLFSGSMDDDGDEAIAYYDRDEDEENIEYRELDLGQLVLEASQIDTTGICTVAQKDRLNKTDQTSDPIKSDNKNKTLSKQQINFPSTKIKISIVLLT